MKRVGDNGALRPLDWSRAMCRALLVCAGLAVLAGCASTGLFKTPEERVTERAQERLDALRKRDIATSFSYVAPALRESTSWQDHAYRYGGVTNWKSAQVDSVTCAPQRCEVTFLVTYEMRRSGMINARSLKEVWIKVDGQWYLYYD